MRPEAVRQDHLMMSRVTAEDQKVTGAGIGGMKLAGPVDGRILLFPDPMGATGSSLSTAIQFYKDKAEAEPPSKIITLNLIITQSTYDGSPRITPTQASMHSDSTGEKAQKDILETVPGTRWSEESGLTENHYIVPGGGGLEKSSITHWSNHD